MSDPQPDPAHLEFLDRLVGTHSEAATPDDAVPMFALYARVSTEDLQDPEGSLARQREEAERLVASSGGLIVATYFDRGYSRSLPWSRRPEADRLLRDSRSADRDWDAIVVGETKRTFYGMQLFDVAPGLLERRVAVWLPEVSGPYDPLNAAHNLILAMHGILGREEREVIRKRVRNQQQAAVKAGDPAHVGGRPPYGYRLEAVGPHRKKRRAAEGQQEHRLVADPTTAPIVRRIFAAYAGGQPIRAIVRELNEDGVPCPSASDPSRNSHRRQDGWQVNTVSTMLHNITYTGYRVWGTVRKVERLVDPDTPALGHRYLRERVSELPAVRSDVPTHEPIVAMETFMQVSTRLAARATGGHRSLGKLSKDRRASVPSALRGLVYCRCGRRMEADRRSWGVRLRCRTRDLVPGATHLHDGEPEPVVNAAAITGELHTWLGELFDPDNLDTTIAAMDAVRSDEALDHPPAAAIEQQIRDLRRRRERLLDLAETQDLADDLATRIRSLTARIVLAETEVATARARGEDALDLRATLGQMADIAGEVLREADEASLRDFYSALRLRVDYDPSTKIASATVIPAGAGGGSVRVRGGT
jgi:site-specific DNA recombinase